MTQRLVFPFPVRPNFMAQLVIPRDMTKAEADRLCAFVMSLAASSPPAMQAQKE